MADNKSDPMLDKALRELEATSASFAMRLIRMAEVRTAYVAQIKEMSLAIRKAVDQGSITAGRGAELANGLRNEIMAMSRERDMDLGRALAQKWKTHGLSLDDSIAAAMRKLGLGGRQFQQLTGAEQEAVFRQVIESAGSSRPKVTQAIPKLRWAGRACWLATFAIAGYNIGTSENPWWQSGRESSNIGGGLGGSIAAGAVAGIWAGPVGVAIGAAVGGILGSLLADRAYVEAAGASDPTTRSFIARFTSFWTGVDENGMASALAGEKRLDLEFVRRVFLSLESDYSTDADDVAVAFMRIARRDAVLDKAVRSHSRLRETIVHVLSGGWKSGDEMEIIRYLQRP